MVKKLLITLLCTASLSLWAQSATFKVVELKGSIDIKERDGKWQKATEGDLLVNGTEIFTGLHSHISLEIGENSYITFNQLTNAILDKIRTQKEEILCEIYLINGYVITSAQDTASYKNRITIAFMDGNAAFENAAGEVYLRKEYGALIKSGRGRIVTASNTLNKYVLHTGEQAAILPGGKMLENQYFLMRNCVGTPAGIASDREKELYYNNFFNYYSDWGSGDYARKGR